MTKKSKLKSLLLFWTVVTTGALRAQDGPPVVGDSTAKTSSPIHFAAGPTNAEASIRDEVRRIGVNTTLTGITNIDELKIMPPLAQYRLAPVGTGHNSNRLETVTANGYFYRLLRGEREAISAEVGVQQYGRIQFSYLGPRVDETVTIALNQVSSLKETQGGSYEARILLLPRGQPLYAGARPFDLIWLKSDNGTNDLLYPVHQKAVLPSTLTIGRAYTPSEFFNIIYPNRK